jgi:hypothetical protein
MQVALAASAGDAAPKGLVRAVPGHVFLETIGDIVVRRIASDILDCDVDSRAGPEALAMGRLRERRHGLAGAVYN